MASIFLYVCIILVYIVRILDWKKTPSILSRLLVYIIYCTFHTLNYDFIMCFFTLVITLSWGVIEEQGYNSGELPCFFVFSSSLLF